ncbi:MAG: ATP-binding protein [Chloroflexota bacterium]|nr:ATP-binding protein [Chloroflexota bacterium]
MLDLAGEQLSLGVSVVLDAVFPLSGFRTAVRGLASEHSARLSVIHCHCSDEAIWKARMEPRPRYVPGWTPVGWEEVEWLRARYEPWDQGEALFVDAVEKPEKNLAVVLEYLRG